MGYSLLEIIDDVGGPVIVSGGEESKRGAYIARITGRDPKYHYSRLFMGAKAYKEDIVTVTVEIADLYLPFDLLEIRSGGSWKHDYRSFYIFKQGELEPISGNRLKQMLDAIESGEVKQIEISKALADKDYVAKLIDQKLSDSWLSMLLHVAVCCNYEETTRILLDRGAKVDSTYVYSAVYKGGNERIFDMLLEKCNDLDINECLRYVYRCAEHLIGKLAKLGANIDLSIGKLGTILSDACFNKPHLAVDLIELGADVNVKNNDGCTPLHYACLGGDLNVVKSLIEHGADMNAVDHKGNTPLHYACEGNHIEVVRFLIEHGADVNAANHKCNTPLHYACKKGHLDIAILLYKAGADIETKNSSGKKPLSLMTKEKRSALKDIVTRMKNASVIAENQTEYEVELDIPRRRL
ncbi:MAG: ankyrin repeat domain-containing protein [Candidatus Methanomethylicaceae archaeon]